MTDIQCTRQGCQEKATEWVRIAGSVHEPQRVMLLCYDHYLELLTVMEMMERLSTTSKKKEGN